MKNIANSSNNYDYHTYGSDRSGNEYDYSHLRESLFIVTIIILEIKY